MIDGVRIRDLKRMPDERGFFAEIFRDDWKDIFGSDKIAQANLSMSYPGVVRGWHRHARGQVDYFCVIKGKMKICVYDDLEGSKTRGHLQEIILSGEKPQIARVPGKYWHGTKCISSEPSMVVYFVTRLYDYKSPDEDRKEPGDPSIKDPKTGEPYVW